MNNLNVSHEVTMCAWKVQKTLYKANRCAFKGPSC